MAFAVKSFGFVILVSLLMLGCAAPQPQPTKADAISVWQHQGSTWDIYYSIWDHDAKKWHTPQGTESAPVFTDPGDDYDPDVSSNDRAAIAVWSKVTGGSSIYYSLWDGSAWSKPAKLSSSDTDTDPTIALDPSGNALAVWVGGGNSLSYAYYRSGLGWNVPAKLSTSGITKISLPELTYSVPDGRYYLVFTGNNGSANFAYAAAYGPGGWSLPVAISEDDQAVLDFDVPTNHRTGISAAQGKSEITAVWPGPSNQVYSVKLGSDARAFSSGKMPDVSYDSSGIARGVMEIDDVLYNEPDVNAPSGDNQISPLVASEDRPSLTFINDGGTGLAVWWSKVEPPGKIYYSYWEGKNWSYPERISQAPDESENRNPAVTPLRKITQIPLCGNGLQQESEQCEIGIACPSGFCGNDCKCYSESYPQCGDGSLEWPWERCETGIECENPNQFCAMPPCICQDKPFYRVSCAGNSLDSAIEGKNDFSSRNFQCKDDCADIDPALSCDPTTCTCKGNALEQNGSSCVLNTISVLSGSANNANTMTCRDDCKLADISMACDPVSCTCKSG